MAQFLQNNQITLDSSRGVTVASLQRVLAAGTDITLTVSGSQLVVNAVGTGSGGLTISQVHTSISAGAGIAESTANNVLTLSGYTFSGTANNIYLTKSGRNITISAASSSGPPGPPGSPGSPGSPGPPGSQSPELVALTGYTFVTTGNPSAGELRFIATSTNGVLTSMKLLAKAKSGDETSLTNMLQDGAQIEVDNTLSGANRVWVEGTVTGVRLISDTTVIEATFDVHSITKSSTNFGTQTGVEIRPVAGPNPKWSDVEFNQSAAPNTHRLASTDWVRKNAGHWYYSNRIAGNNTTGSIEFSNIPDRVEDIVISFDNLTSSQTTNNFEIHVGDANYKTSGYEVFRFVRDINSGLGDWGKSTTEIIIPRGNAADYTVGRLLISRSDLNGLWDVTGIAGEFGGNYNVTYGGNLTCGNINKVRIKNIQDTLHNFTGGSVIVKYR